MQHHFGYQFLKCSSLSNNANGIVNIILLLSKGKKIKNNFLNIEVDWQNNKINNLYVIMELHLYLCVYSDIFL